MCNMYCLWMAKLIRENTWMLGYKYIVCLVNCHKNINVQLSLIYILLNDCVLGPPCTHRNLLWSTSNNSIQTQHNLKITCCHIVPPIITIVTSFMPSVFQNQIFQPLAVSSHPHTDIFSVVWWCDRTIDLLWKWVSSSLWRLAVC